MAFLLIDARKIHPPYVLFDIGKFIGNLRRFWRIMVKLDNSVGSGRHLILEKIRYIRIGIFYIGKNFCHPRLTEFVSLGIRAFYITHQIYEKVMSLRSIPMKII
ncbi:hypothetical protein SB4_03335 [Sphingomonas sanguinis]|uniref:Uncharacterized protein n=1 Tax=Sphingomonas sanguinis TaxID=33051 RepID=A0A147J1Q5_9SPHN|nr:hypothetical protein SB4_03335 [Sphingomonas sanguinis]